MTTEELKTKLQASEERLSKAITLKTKYENKEAKIQAELNKLANTYNIDLSNIGPGHFGNINDEVRRLYWDLTYATEAVKDSERKIKDLTQTRDNWKTRLEMQKAKDNEFAEVPEIVKEFVHTWRIKTEEWIRNKLEEYTKRRQEAYAIYEKASDYSNDLSYEERRELKYN